MSEPAQQKFIIGFSQCVESDKWRQTMLDEMHRELAFHNNVTFIYKEAGDNSDKQIAQVNQLLSDKIDLLIISPNEALPLTPVVEKVFNRGIPVIVIDRKVASASYTAYIGADNYEVGRIAGQYAASLLKEKGTITEVTGLPGSSPAIERHNGFVDALKDYPQIKIVNQIKGDWLRNKAFTGVKNNSATILSSDLVFAHNDMMAIGTREALPDNSVSQKLKILGIDALPGSDAGISFVAQKKITASMLYPTGGDEAIRLAFRILNREAFKKENILNTLVVDSSNVRLMKLQTDKISSQQKDIENQQKLVKEQRRIYNSQRTFSSILTAALFLVILLAAAVFYSWRKNKKITRKLRAKNDEILIQQEKLIEMSAKAEDAHQARLNFFTNISHEFRTPLTLILSPLEDLLENEKIRSVTRHSLQLVQRNVMRLYKLVNQLMDFRKIEFNKMTLRASENDFVAFAKEITESYEVLAGHKHINLRFFTSERQLMVWFDISMIDKVIFNLLSNAFKFTNENGFIHVSLTRDEHNAMLSVEDNGIGMSADALEHAFDPFFQGEYENYKGTGLGLALSKELMGIHKGKIKVESQKGKGTRFELNLPLGKAHITDSETIEKPDPDTIADDVKIYTTELYNDTEPATEPNNMANDDYRASILIVEDNSDLRNYLSSSLGKSNDIIEAEDGLTALDLAFDNVPDLIICDVVLPGKNGLEVTHLLKKDIRTAHIPIVLLTARSEEKQRIEGLETKADAYMTKPFNIKILNETVRTLLANREKMKSHYSSEILPEEKSQIIKKSDRKFMVDFCALVEDNIANDKFGVEDLCSKMGISRVQLYRKVKTVFHCNVNDYIVNTRMQKAKHYLQHEDLSIGEIAYRCGFSSAAYFSTLFKSKFNCTPSEYKLNRKV